MVRYKHLNSGIDIHLLMLSHTAAIYGNQLAKVIHQMIVIGQVAALGREFEMRLHDPVSNSSAISRYRTSRGQPFDWSWQGFDGSGLVDDDEQADDEQTNSQQRCGVVSNHIGGNKSTSPNVESVIDMKRRDQVTGILKSSERMKMIQLLEAWEEPEKEPGKLVSVCMPQTKEKCTILIHDTLIACAAKDFHQCNSPIPAVSSIHGLIISFRYGFWAC